MAGLCDVNAQCIYDDDQRRYACLCNRGFEGDGRQCTRIGNELFTAQSRARLRACRTR